MSGFAWDMEITIARLENELAEQRKRAGRAEEKLRGLESWLQTVLNTRLAHRGYASDSGHPHGGAVAEIPEWELRRHLDECREALDDGRKGENLEGGNRP